MSTFEVGLLIAFCLGFHVLWSISPRLRTSEWFGPGVHVPYLLLLTLAGVLWFG